MRCPTCKKEFYPQPENLATVWADDEEDSDRAERYSIQQCPSCYEIVVIKEEGSAWDKNGEPSMKQVDVTTIVYPPSNELTLAEEIPRQYRDDLLEANTALDYSAKASAALSRRLLQKTFREHLNIKRKDLSLEIEAFIETSGAPSYLTGAVDAIRHVGNFAAHPIKNTNTGEIVDVEPGEAEWLVEVLESLFDYAFVQPAKLRARRDSLNEKLRALGKPELKGDGT